MWNNDQFFSAELRRMTFHSEKRSGANNFSDILVMLYFSRKLDHHPRVHYTNVFDAIVNRHTLLLP